MHPLQAALAAIQRGALDEATPILDDVLRRNPQDYQALQLKGLVLRRKGDLTSAAKFFQQSLQLNDKQPHVLNNLGITLSALGRLLEAEDSYCRALAQDPAYADALFNLGLLKTELKDYAAAQNFLLQALEIQPTNAAAYEALSIAQRHLSAHALSLQNAQLAVKFGPNAYSTHYQLGQAHMGLSEFKAAAAAYKNAVTLNPKSDVAWIGLGHALRGMGSAAQSREAYQRAVDLKPGNPDAHRLLNEMVWQTGDVANYLKSFPTALREKADDYRLRLAYANELLKISQAAAATQELEAALKFSPHDGDILEALARSKSLVGEFDAATHFHARALEETPTNPLFVRSFAETLLRSRDHHKAYRVTEAGLKRFPFEQGVMALHTTAQRLTGDERYAFIADYGGIAKVMRLEAPPGYDTIEAFCSDLKIFLEGLHTTKAHPTDQTLRGGTQTFGALFQHQAPVLQQFVTQLRKSISGYIAEMPKDETHPLFLRARPNFDFAGSWSVRLSAGGYHTNHFHPDGWISSAFYVDVPECVNAGDGNPGWLKFGETNLDLGDREVIHRMIQPKVGHLALFPSYFWHGTVPFESTSPRITIAFDVIPK